MKKLLLGSVALLALVAGPATAADMAVKAPVYRPGVHPYCETEKSGQISLDPAVERSVTLNSRVGFASISAGAL
jgi:hypothetical protein